MLYLIKGIGQKNGGDMPEQSSTQTAVQQALIEQVTQYIAQYTPQPRIISYKPNASGDVMGKFESQSRVFTFRLSDKGLVYKPLVQRKDNESDDDYALRFDTGSELWLEHFDAAKAFKPKPSVTVKKERGDRKNPKCSAISYHCGVCISLGKNCIKNANTAALKERLQKINSLSRMAAKGEAVPQVKTGVIGARVDPKSLMKKAQGQARELAKNGKTSTNPRAKVTPPQYSPEVQEFITAGERRVKKLSQDLAFFKKEGKSRKVKETQQLLDIQTKDLAALKKRTLDVDQKRAEDAAKSQSQKDVEIKSLVSAKPSVEPESIKTRYTNKAEEVGVLKAFDGVAENSPLHGESLYKRIKRGFGDKAKKLGLGGIADGYDHFQKPLESLESKGWIAKVPSLGWNVSEGAIQTGLPMGGFSNSSKIKRSEVAPRKNEDPLGFSYVLTDAGKKALVLAEQPTTRDRQSAARAAAEPNKTTTLSTPLPLTAQSQKRLERGESISDNETYHVKKEGNKFRVTDPNKFEDKGKLVDKAGLAAHMKELEAQPKAVRKSSSMNPVIPINSNPDTMLRALRDGRLIGDAKQGYEIQQRGKDEYLVTTMPNKNGDYSGVMSRKELVEFVKGGGDASRFNKEQTKTNTPWQKEFSEKYHSVNSDKKPSQAIVRTYSASNGDGKGSGVTVTFDTDVFDDKKLKPILTAYAKHGLLASVVEHPAPNVLSFRNPDTEVLNGKEKHLEIAKNLAGLGIDVKSDRLVNGKTEGSKSTESNYIPLTSGKNLTPSQKKQSRSTDQIAIDRTKSDVSNATKRINTLDDSIKKLKAGKGVMSEADLKKVASLERQKAEWEKTREGHRAKLSKLTKGDESKPVASPKIDRQEYKNINSALPETLGNDKKSLIARRIADLNHGQDVITDDSINRALSSVSIKDGKGQVVEALSKAGFKVEPPLNSMNPQDMIAALSRSGGDIQDKKDKIASYAQANGLKYSDLMKQFRASSEPDIQGTGETEAERRQFLLNTNTEQTNKKTEPKREIELADIKTPQDKLKYANQELAIAKASKDPERINKWIDEVQRAKKGVMSSTQAANNTYQPDLFFVNKGNPSQKSIFDSKNFDAEYDDSVERNILSNIGLMLSRAMSGNQTSPNTVQLRKVKYADGSVSGTFTQYGAQYDFEISTKGVVINPLRVRQDRIAGVPYTKTKTVGANRKCGRGYKCKGTCISKNNKCRVDWATKQGLEQFKSMKAELDALVSPRFIEINGRQVAQQRSPEGDAKALALAKRLSEARGARKQFADESKTKAAKYYKTIGDRVDAKVAEKLKEAGLNVKQVKSTLAELDPKDIAVDPKRFQYKITGEHTASGTVGSLQGVGKWDENLAGILQVWKDPADGKTYVVNGHNRLSKANELGAEKVAVRYLDVPSHQEARTIGAMTNIAEGHGTALDAAKFFRDTNWTKEDVVKKGIPLKEKIATDGLAIASLEANLFRQVIDGELPIERAAIIGGNGLSHEKQKSLMELLEKRKSVNNSVLSELIDTVKNSGQKQEEQFDLFGNSTATVDLAIHRASLQSHIKQKLGSEKKLFGTVSKSKSAKDLERGGNQIDVDQSSKIADQAATALKMFDTIKHMSGGVSDTLNNASERLANAKTKSEREKINRETYESVLKEIQRENDKFFKAGKRSDSQQRADSNDFGCDCILTYVTDNSGNLMGVCQINGVKYRFLKPVFGATVLTPLSETGLGYLFGMAPDLSLREDDPLKGIFTLFFDPLNKALASR
jgi:hypothetical protein